MQLWSRCRVSVWNEVGLKPEGRYAAGLTGSFVYPELRRYRAAVYFPDVPNQLAFFELYAMGAPRSRC